LTCPLLDISFGYISLELRAGATLYLARTQVFVILPVWMAPSDP
jgi:hypothetical protein